METFPRYWPFVWAIHRWPVNSPQRPVTQSFGVSFDLRLNKRLSKQSRRLWFETPSRLLWRHCNRNIVPLSHERISRTHHKWKKLWNSCSYDEPNVIIIISRGICTFVHFIEEIINIVVNHYSKINQYQPSCCCLYVCVCACVCVFIHLKRTIDTFQRYFWR